jgi:hypothetical protein
MARPEITGCAPSEGAHARKRMRRARGPPSCAFTIQEFCDTHRISRAHYYNMRKLGLGPDEARVGDRVIITLESAARWRRQREKAARA